MSRKVKRKSGNIPQLRWWAIAAVYRCIHVGAKSRYLSKSLSERRVFLIQAKNEAEAQHCGLEMVKKHEHQYKNVLGDLVCWKLKKVERIVSLVDTQIGHGAEVYWEWIVDGKTRRRKPLSV